MNGRTADLNLALQFVNLHIDSNKEIATRSLDALALEALRGHTASYPAHRLARGRLAWTESKHLYECVRRVVDVPGVVVPACRLQRMPDATRKEIALACTASDLKAASARVERVLKRRARMNHWPLSDDEITDLAATAASKTAMAYGNPNAPPLLTIALNAGRDETRRRIAHDAKVRDAAILTPTFAAPPSARLRGEPHGPASLRFLTRNERDAIQLEHGEIGPWAKANGIGKNTATKIRGQGVAKATMTRVWDDLVDLGRVVVDNDASETKRQAALKTLMAAITPADRPRAVLAGTVLVGVVELLSEHDPEAAALLESEGMAKINVALAEVAEVDRRVA